MTDGGEPLASLLDRLGADPSTPGVRAWRAPGRVNLIGEHVDYLGGTVLPFACDREIRLVTLPRDGEVVVSSEDAPGEVRIPLDGSAAAPQGWGRYVAGVVAALRADGRPVRGFRGVLSSSIPVGAGLSSSAALIAVLAMALLDGERPPPQLLQSAEHCAVGVPCGVMDHVAVLHGRAGHALEVDCAAVTWRAIPLPSVGVVVIDTGTRRSLDDGRYAERRRETEDALRISQAGGEAGDVGRRRLRHVASEEERVGGFIAAMQNGDVAALGALVNESHASLREDFEVSSPALEAGVTAARSRPECLGARLVGAGFAGCVLALVRAGSEDAFVAAVTEALSDARVFAVTATDGAGPMTLPRG